MQQIQDAPWIRDAEINGYPVGDDEEIEEVTKLIGGNRK